MDELARSKRPRARAVRPPRFCPAFGEDSDTLVERKYGDIPLFPEDEVFLPGDEPYGSYDGQLRVCGMGVRWMFEDLFRSSEEQSQVDVVCRNMFIAWIVSLVIGLVLFARSVAPCGSVEEPKLLVWLLNDTSVYDVGTTPHRGANASLDTGNASSFERPMEAFKRFDKDLGVSGGRR